MAFIFTCGTHTFQSLLSPYENITAQCQNCGNYSAKIVKRWEWFTFCFVPIIPFSFKPWHEVACHICSRHQDIKQRPDVQQMMDSGGQSIPMHNQSGPPQGWQGQQHPPPQQYAPPQQYGQGAQPVYK